MLLGIPRSGHSKSLLVPNPPPHPRVEKKWQQWNYLWAAALPEAEACAPQKFLMAHAK
jgi:hypothetical protein